MYFLAACEIFLLWFPLHFQGLSEHHGNPSEDAKERKTHLAIASNTRCSGLYQQPIPAPFCRFCKWIPHFSSVGDSKIVWPGLEQTRVRWTVLLCGKTQRRMTYCLQGYESTHSGQSEEKAGRMLKRRFGICPLVWKRGENPYHDCSKGNMCLRRFGVLLVS